MRITKYGHFDADRLRGRPDLPVYTCPGVARRLEDLGDRVRVVENGDVLDVAGFRVTVVGEKHHVSHPDVPPVDNVGFLVDGEVFHPGDALTVVEVATLLAPGQAPWMTVPDLIRYLRAVRPRRAYAIHDGLLNQWGLKVLDGVLDSEGERLGAEFRRLPVGGSAEV
ncbi:MBL fold metallo-hydrolase [Nonomuraea sp. CA-218870]|uniref:MBL fold metallo-hydrolase n=1 Tax=Nonomuraea sp. CA-218870 TaxID=3239998 RepID=UPI003D8CF452